MNDYVVIGRECSYWAPHKAGYVLSTLMNGGNNTQHDLRLAAGISFHLKD